jgi:hypothetical protein
LQINHLKFLPSALNEAKSVDPRPRAPLTKTCENNKNPLFTKQNHPNDLPTYYLDDPEPARIRSSFAPALNPNRTGGIFPPAIDILYALRKAFPYLGLMTFGMFIY